MKKSGRGDGEAVPDTSARTQLPQIIHILAHDDEDLDEVRGKVHILLGAVGFVDERIRVFPEISPDSLIKQSTSVKRREKILSWINKFSLPGGIHPEDLINEALQFDP